MAVIEPTDAGLVLRERGPGVATRQIEQATAASLIVEGDPPETASAADKGKIIPIPDSELSH
jgi:hypothetical protein